jgi:hypothetical protein
MAEEYHNKVWAIGRLIIQSQGCMSLHDMSERSAISVNGCYLARLAFYGACAALREAGYLPGDSATTIEGRDNGPYAGMGKGEIVSLNEAKQLLGGTGPQVMVGQKTKRKGL